MSWIDRIQQSARFLNGLKRRVPPARTAELGLNNIFILPTPEGGLYVLAALVVWIAGINYQNSLMLALAFFMLAMFSVVMVSTYRNLAGLKLTIMPETLIEVGRLASNTLVAEASSDRAAIYCSYGTQTPTLLEVPARGQVAVEVPIVANRRGPHNPGRLKLETRYPQGLFRAWSLIEFSEYALAYPRPIEGERPASGASDQIDGGLRIDQATRDNKIGARPYQDGDDSRSIDWRVTARFQSLHSTEFERPKQQTRRLCWSDYSHLEFEEALGRLCFWVIELSRLELDFSLELPNDELATGHGYHHSQAALTLLAISELGRQA